MQKQIKVNNQRVQESLNKNEASKMKQYRVYELQANKVKKQEATKKVNDVLNRYIENGKNYSIEQKFAMLEDWQLTDLIAEFDYEDEAAKTLLDKLIYNAVETILKKSTRAKLLKLSMTIIKLKKPYYQELIGFNELENELINYVWADGTTIIKHMIADINNRKLLQRG